MTNSKFYRCEKCGKLVCTVLDGSGSLVCCDVLMTLLIPNSVDASKEKHVPVAVLNNDIIDVTVGSVPHPMLNEHYIQWIALLSDNKTEIVYLTPSQPPVAKFVYTPNTYKLDVVNNSSDEEIVPNCEGEPCNFSYSEVAKDFVEIYAYCNLHGLWKVVI